jgi:hypothetical protein
LVLEELAVVALQLVQLVELLHSRRGLLLTQLLEEVVVVIAITTVVIALTV